MPLNKRKIRKILSAFEPSLKPDLLVSQLKEDTNDSLKELVSKLVVKFGELRKEVLSEVLEEIDSRLEELPDYSKEISSLKSELEIRVKELEKEEIPVIQAQMQDLVSNEIDTEELRKDLEEKIKDIRTEFLKRLSNLGGGNANRQINVNSSVMSTRYTDINFIPGSVMGIAVANDDVYKRVNITFSGTGGSVSPAVSVTDETTYGIASAIGTSLNYARQDHTHGTVVTPTASTVGLGNVGNFVTNAGVYSPEVTEETNLDATTTATEAQYVRVGNTVTVSGRFTANPTLTATMTSFELALPIVSNIGAAEDVAGVAFSGAIAGMGGAIFGVVATDTAKVTWVASDPNAQNWSYIFNYQII